MPYQALAADAHGLSRAQTERAAWWIAADGSLHRGHRALGRAMRMCRRPWPLVARVFLLTPPMSWLAALGYRIVARLRKRLPGSTPACERDWDTEAF